MEGRGLWTCREKSVSAFQYSQVVPRAFCPRITSPSSGFFSSSCHYLWKSGKRRIVAIFRRKVVFIIKSIFRDILILLGYLKYVVTSTDLLRARVCVVLYYSINIWFSPKLANKGNSVFTTLYSCRNSILYTYVKKIYINAKKRDTNLIFVQ